LAKALIYLNPGGTQTSAKRWFNCVPQHSKLETRENLLEIDIRGNAFLRQMVRIMVGTLSEVGTGRIGVRQVAEILAAKDRTKAGVTAPAQGLELMEVRYDGTRVAPV